MALGVTRLADVIVPEIFNPQVQQITTQRSRLIESGAFNVDVRLNAELAGPGLTFQNPYFNDLDDDPENISSDDPAVHSSPYKISTAREIQVRLSRNNSWSSMDLVAELLGADPMNAIANRVGAYWTRRLQDAVIATMKGVFAHNTATDAGDLTFNASGAAFTAGVTDFSTESFLSAAATMGDRAEELGVVMVHSVVYGRMQRNNLIDFVPDARGEINIPTFLGRRVVIDDGMPNAVGVFETWIFGQGAVKLGIGSPKVPTETERKPSAGNGGGQEILYNRVEWMIHPVGHAYVGTPPPGGPSNAATANNLAAAASWDRVFRERKQVKIARLLTREF
jgi:hypothetical protein